MVDVELCDSADKPSCTTRCQDYIMPNTPLSNQGAHFHFCDAARTGNVSAVLGHAVFFIFGPSKVSPKRPVTTFSYILSSCFHLPIGSEGAKELGVFNSLYVPVKWRALWSYLEFPNHLIDNISHIQILSIDYP